jgi:hypothetical protein
MRLGLQESTNRKQSMNHIEIILQKRNRSMRPSIKRPANDVKCDIDRVKKILGLSLVKNQQIAFRLIKFVSF